MENMFALAKLRPSITIYKSVFTHLRCSGGKSSSPKGRASSSKITNTEVTMYVSKAAVNRYLESRRVKDYCRKTGTELMLQ